MAPLSIKDSNMFVIVKSNLVKAILLILFRQDIVRSLNLIFLLLEILAPIITKTK